MSLRDIKTAARLALHGAMKVDALYIAGDADPVPCTVRVHSDSKALGDVRGTSLGYAERHELIPRLIFLVSEIAAPVRGAYVTISADEAYAIDNLMPRDGITITAEVSALTPSQRSGLPYPGSP